MTRYGRGSWARRLHQMLRWRRWWTKSGRLTHDSKLRLALVSASLCLHALVGIAVVVLAAAPLFRAICFAALSISFCAGVRRLWNVVEPPTSVPREAEVWADGSMLMGRGAVVSDLTSRNVYWVSASNSTESMRRRVRIALRHRAILERMSTTDV